jgi:hypothetical protein
MKKACPPDGPFFFHKNPATLVTPALRRRGDSFSSSTNHEENSHV